MTITKVIFPKPAQLILSHLSKQFHSSSYSEEDLFSFLSHPISIRKSHELLSSSHSYLPHLYTLFKPASSFFLDHCSDLLSPASTLAPLQFRLHIVMLLKHEARYQSFTQNMPAYSKYNIGPVTPCIILLLGTSLTSSVFSSLTLP